MLDDRIQMQWFQLQRPCGAVDWLSFEYEGFDVAPETSKKWYSGTVDSAVREDPDDSGALGYMVRWHQGDGTRQGGRGSRSWHTLRAEDLAQGHWRFAGGRK